MKPKSTLFETKNNKHIASREISIDIIKVLGILSVIVLHFTEYFYSSTTEEFFYLSLNSYRWFVFGCIGYFILATGYLNCTKRVEIKYFFKIIPIICIFLFYSILTHIIISPYTGNDSLFIYLYSGIKWYFWNYNGYYWYMNFYLAFFLLIPFLNQMLNGISQQQHKMLIGICILIFSAPEFIQILGDFLLPVKNSGISLPSYFSADNFPFIYYFIGSYIRKYINETTLGQRIKYICVCISSLLIHSLLDWTYLKKYSSLFQAGQHIYTFNSYGNIFTIISCTCLLLALNGLDWKNNFSKTILTFLSSHTLEMYLCLSIADKLVTRFCEHINYNIDCTLTGFVIWLGGELIVILAGTFLWIGIKFCISNAKHFLTSLR